MEALTFKLEEFEGPLDLLLYLVSKNKMDLYDIPILELIDQYTALINTLEEGRLEAILKEHLELDHVTLIACGQGSEMNAAREQWSDGSNTLTIAPGEVVVYSRNYVTNRSLEEAGIKIHTIPSAELSRGRGGPRCMSMPLWREDP